MRWFSMFNVDWLSFVKFSNEWMGASEIYMSDQEEYKTGNIFGKILGSFSTKIWMETVFSRQNTMILIWVEVSQKT